MDAMVVAPAQTVRPAPPVTTLLTHLDTLHTLASAGDPLDIAAAWQQAQQVAVAYGVDSGSSIAVGDASKLRTMLFRVLREPISHAVIARAPEIDPAALNGQRRVLALSQQLANFGIITFDASDALIRSAACALDVPAQQPLTALAGILKAATMYMTATEMPSDEMLDVLAAAYAHHGVTRESLKLPAREQRHAELVKIPYFTMELEHRLDRIIARVTTENELRTQFGLTFDDISAAGAAGVISQSVVDGVWKILHEREELQQHLHHNAALNRGGLIISTAMGAFSFLMWLAHLGSMSPAEDNIMRKMTWVCGGAAVYFGAQWFLSSGRKKS